MSVKPRRRDMLASPTLRQRISRGHSGEGIHSSGNSPETVA